MQTVSLFEILNQLSAMRAFAAILAPPSALPRAIKPTARQAGRDDGASRPGAAGLAEAARRCRVHR